MVESDCSTLLLPLNTVSASSSFPVWWPAQTQMLPALSWDQCVHGCRVSLLVLWTCHMDISGQQRLFLLSFKWDLELQMKGSVEQWSAAQVLQLVRNLSFNQSSASLGLNFLIQMVPASWGFGTLDWMQEKLFVVC